MRGSPPGGLRGRESETARLGGGGPFLFWDAHSLQRRLWSRFVRATSIAAPHRRRIMRWVNADDIRRILTFPLLVDAFEEAHRRRKMDIQDAFLGGEGGLYFVRHAVDPGRYMGSKLITSFPANLASG